MFPLRDSAPSRRFPWVTLALIAANVAAFAWQLGAGEQATLALALVPAEVVRAVDQVGPATLTLGTLLTSMFLHGGLLHLGSNMWFLWIFGDNVEDRFGRLGFLLFYLTCGLAAALGQVAVDPRSAIPVVGASGAIGGVLGAYLWFFPRARILTVVPIFFFLQFVELPALVFLGLWFVLQAVYSAAGVEGVAWWAHIAGFGAGLVLGVGRSLVSPAPRRAPAPRRRR